MQKQLYKIEKTDWVGSIQTLKDGKKCVKYFYGSSLKEVKAWAEGKKGKVQFFKLSYEFKSAKIQE